MQLYKRQVRLCGELQIDTHEIPEYRTLIDWTDEEDFTDEIVKDAIKDYFDKNNVCWWDFYQQERYLEINPNSETPLICPYCNKSSGVHSLHLEISGNTLIELCHCDSCAKNYYVEYGITNKKILKENS